MNGDDRRAQLRGSVRLSDSKSLLDLIYLNRAACSFSATRTPRKVKKRLKALWRAHQAALGVEDI